MYTFILILFVLTALLLIGVVLIQQPKSAGGGLFAGTGQSLLGTSGKTFWTKFTTILAALFMLLCLGLSILPRLQGPGSSVADSIMKQEKASQAAAGASAPQPAAQPPAGTAKKP
ncbi:MAG TPA: preprotein translocase subunit SecG [bacterium]|nr:preprotein translocase subunit SecG [bacterium]